jgi:hydroxymethylpyrimidine pyrophosphatase-like HAD family hydrolase
MPSLLPLTKLDASGIVGVFTDVDDTLTWDGQLDGATYQALESLSAAGLKVIPVTGRSSGWGHMMMSSWPIDAVVAESFIPQ